MREPDRPLRGLINGIAIARMTKLNAAIAMPMRQPSSPKFTAVGAASKANGCMDWASAELSWVGIESIFEACVSNSINLNSFLSGLISIRWPLDKMKNRSRSRVSMMPVCAVTIDWVLFSLETTNIRLPVFSATLELSMKNTRFPSADS